MMTVDFYDFFSGCGGTSCGMQQAGMTVRFGLDIDPDARETWEANFKRAKFLCKDIRHVSVDDVAPYIKRRYDRPLFFGACTPCQPFSRQNRTKKDGDDRRDLLGEFHRFVKAYMPEYIFVENVPGMQSENPSMGPFTNFVRLLDALKYFHDNNVVMACHYGVPQRRRRLVLLASRLGPIKIPPPTRGPGTDDPSLPTVWEFISDLPPIKAGETHPTVANHRAARLSHTNMSRIAETPPGGSRRDWPQELELSCHRDHTGHTDVYGRMIRDQPSPALTTRCTSLSNGRFGHPVQDRAISVREAASIQTFPEEFTFYGNLVSMTRQVGNAVPVDLAEEFGRSIIRHYRFHKKSKST